MTDNGTRLNPNPKYRPFEFNGITIVDPTLSECGRFTVNPYEYYGVLPINENEWTPEDVARSFNAYIARLDGNPPAWEDLPEEDKEYMFNLADSPIFWEDPINAITEDLTRIDW